MRYRDLFEAPGLKDLVSKLAIAYVLSKARPISQQKKVWKPKPSLLPKPKLQEGVKDPTFQFHYHPDDPDSVEKLRVLKGRHEDDHDVKLLLTRKHPTKGHELHLIKDDMFGDDEDHEGHDFQTHLSNAHEKEQTRRRAIAYNFGHSGDGESVSSKTSKGYHTTSYDADSMGFVHHWDD